MKPVDVEPRYLLYICLWSEFVETVRASALGSKMPRAQWAYVGNVSVPVPDRTKQRAISTYLDRETGRLDALLAEKERLLSLLNEKRVTLLTSAVTRGVYGDVPVRDSGIPWLGDFPEQWESCKVAWLFRERDQRGRPDLPLLEVSLSLDVVQRDFTSDEIESTAADRSSYKVVRKGDVIVNKMRLWKGAVGVAPMDGLVSSDYVVAEPTGALTSAYSSLLFSVPAFCAECARRSHGQVWNRLRVSWEGFRDIRVPVPTFPEQTAIVSHVRDRTSVLNELVSVIDTSITLVHERRRALIAAAITGRIDVKDIVCG